jgi:Protein of unknown function (DUF1580)
MIDIETEQLLSLRAAALWLAARTGTPAPHVHTVRRWALAGVRGAVLDVVRIGCRTFTSIEALQRFATARYAPERPKATPNKRREKERAEADRRAKEVFG